MNDKRRQDNDRTLQQAGEQFTRDLERRFEQDPPDRLGSQPSRHRDPKGR
jgi:hypothetical protein